MWYTGCVSFNRLCMYVCMYVRYIWCHMLHWILIAKQHFLWLQFSLCLIKCNWIFFCETFILWLYICSCKMVFKTNSCELNTLVLGMVVFFLSFFVWNFLKIIVLLLTNNSAVFIIIFSVNWIKIRSVHLLPPYSLSLCRDKEKGGIDTEYQSKQLKKISATTGWLQIRKICPSGATCMSTDCCFSERSL